MEKKKEAEIASRKRKKLVKELVLNYHQVRKENSAPGLREMTLTPEQRWRYMKSLKKDAPISIPERSPSPSPDVPSIPPISPIIGNIGSFSVLPPPLNFERLEKLSFVQDQPEGRNEVSPNKIPFPPNQVQEVGSSSMPQPQVENLVGNEDEIFGDILKEISQEEERQHHHQIDQIHGIAQESQVQDMVVVEDQVQMVLEENTPLTLETQNEESGDTIPMEDSYSDEEVFMECVQFSFMEFSLKWWKVVHHLFREGIRLGSMEG